MGKIMAMGKSGCRGLIGGADNLQRTIYKIKRCMILSVAHLCKTGLMAFC
jgi:hypothetical protein